MKIVMFSDSHGFVEIMCGVVEKEKPDMIIHLGDSIRDAEQLNVKYPDIEMISVLGNVDSEKEDEEWIKYAEICGKRFMLTHGHTFLNNISYREGQGNMFRYPPDDVDIILHGHTHEPYVHRSINGVKRISRWMMNPGSMKAETQYDDIYSPTYGVLNINESGDLEWQIIEVK